MHDAACMEVHDACMVVWWLGERVYGTAGVCVCVWVCGRVGVGVCIVEEGEQLTPVSYTPFQ